MSGRESTDTALEAMPDTLFSVGQIRLSELSLFNWGSFHGLRTVSIQPDGTLFTGDNGAGKSTAIDGLMALLLPAGKAQFNVAAAQGDKADRSLLSYIRGTFGTEHDGASTRVKNKRNGAVCSALRARYQADDGSVITLAAMFFVPKAGRTVRDIERIYIVAKRDLTLKELLDIFGDGDKRRLKQQLRNDATIKSFEGKFSAYQEYYSKVLHIENRNAPNLLSRALGLKKIDDLTDLIRDLVLEPSKIREDAKKIVEEFSDLVGIHNELQDCKNQTDALASLPEEYASYLANEQSAAYVMQLRDKLPVFIGEQTASLWKNQVDIISRSIDESEIALGRLNEHKKICEEQRDRRLKNYMDAGGNRIMEVKKDLENTKKEYTVINKRASSYQAVADVLGLDKSLREQSFVSNRQYAQESQRQIVDESDSAQNEFGDLRGKLTNLQTTQRQLQDDRAELSKRAGSSIDPMFQRLKAEMVKSLEVDEDDFVFIGELIAVREEDKVWQGAIERAMGGLSTTLLVPAANRSMVSQWLNSRHTGLHVRIEEVKDGPTGQTTFKANGFLRKLEWKTHSYRDWLKQHLMRFELSCVDSTFELDAVEFSMTKEGLIRKHKGRMEKNDSRKVNDRRYWNIGFSNKTRLEQLDKEIAKIGHEIAEVNKSAADARDQWNSISQRKADLEKLLTYSWEDIDVQYTRDLITMYETEIEDLEASDRSLYELEQQYEVAKVEVSTVDDKIIETNGKIVLLNKDYENASSSWEDSKKIAADGLEDWEREGLSNHVEPLNMESLSVIHKIISDSTKALQKELDRFRGRQQSHLVEATAIMNRFRAHEGWRVIAEDWGADIDSADHYIKHFRYLIADGLPALQEKFLVKLNQDSTQSLASLRQRLQSEHEDIQDRIETINKVLHKTEFREGTYLKLLRRREDYPHVKDFQNKVIRVLNHATLDDPLARFGTVREVIEIIEKASILSPGTLESMQLLDPRHQLRFIAEEIRRCDNEVIDTLTSSSGKSGGEKESFAGIIVAASLAYVLTPDGYDKPVYSTVFLDEAFSNTSEKVSRRVLRVFKELNIHINLITPYKNLNIARESATSVLIAERNADTHESRFIEMTWEQADDFIEDLERRKALREANEAGIEIEVHE